MAAHLKHPYDTMNDEATNEDPLGIDKLSVDYDYLLYKIADYVSSIEFQTNQICKRQHELITEHIVSEIVEENIKMFKELMRKCEELENHFDMLDQINLITEKFKMRLAQVSRDYKELNKRGITS
ncbi:CNL1 (YDR357C) [Zygosaccharomyces parabailii]|nr:CNL1 (YDR357C) [Zygosaccharomyces parabailii]